MQDHAVSSFAKVSELFTGILFCQHFACTCHCRKCTSNFPICRYELANPVWRFTTWILENYCDKRAFNFRWRSSAHEFEIAHFVSLNPEDRVIIHQTNAIRPSVYITVTVPACQSSHESVWKSSRCPILPNWGWLKFPVTEDSESVSCIGPLAFDLISSSKAGIQHVICLHIFVRVTVIFCAQILNNGHIP